MGHEEDARGKVLLDPALPLTEMPKPARRNLLAEAHQANRDLKNRIHEYESDVVLPLRSEIAALKQRVTALTLDKERTATLLSAYSDATRSLLRLFHALELPLTKVPR